MDDDESPRILFVCRHGAAKSVLAAADLRTVAAERGLRIVAEAAGVEPSEEISPAVVQAISADAIDVGRPVPRRVTRRALQSASRVITFNLELSDLPAAVSGVERWDDVPAVSEDLQGARAAIGRHLERLLEGLDRG